MAEIPYTEQFNPSPKDFVQSRMEYEGIEGEQICEQYSFHPIGGMGQTIYEVPANKTLFITSAFVSAYNCNYVYFGNQESVGGAVYTVICYVVCGANVTSNQAISFPMPIKCREGTIIRIHPNGAGGLASAGFHGFLIDKII